MENLTPSAAASVPAINVAPVVPAAIDVKVDVSAAAIDATTLTTTISTRATKNNTTTTTDAASAATPTTIKSMDNPTATTITLATASTTPTKIFTTRLAASTSFLTTKALNNINMTTITTTKASPASTSNTIPRRANDPFATLPDTALINIVHLLPFEDAARTPAISPAFGFVWPCSRKVVLDESGFTADATRRALESQGRRSLAKGVRDTGRTAFVNYARRYAERYKENKVDEFVLRFSLPGQYPDDVKKWIDIAALRSAESVEIDFSDHDLDNNYPEGYAGAVQLPPNVYSTKLRMSLQTLKLSGCIVVPAILGTLEALLELHIARTELTRIMQCFVIAECRQLEDLTLLKVDKLDGVLVRGGRHSHLIRLTMDDCKPLGDGVEIDSTMLSYFKYRGAIVSFRLEVPNLVEAELDFYTEQDYNGWGDLVHILYDLRAAMILTLCSYCLQILPSSIPGPIQLQGGFLVGNPSHLTLNKVSLHRDELPGISILLQTYKELELLTFKLGPPRVLNNYEYPYPLVYDGFEFWATQFGPFPCFENHLRIVRMEGFRGKINEVAMLRFLLERARLLQEVMVNVAKDTPTATDGYMAVGLGLHQFNRASLNVRITVT